MGINTTKRKQSTPYKRPMPPPSASLRERVEGEQEVVFLSPLPLGEGYGLTEPLFIVYTIMYIHKNEVHK